MGYTVLMDREYWTIKEALFDVFSINNTTLSKVRFGDGNDGSINLT